jgi:O-antigen ligase
MIALLTGSADSIFGLYVGFGIIGAMVLTVILLLRQDELAATMVIAVSLYVDWYLNLHIVAVTITVVLLLNFWCTRSVRHLWVEPPAWWLWILFLALNVYPAVQGALKLYDAADYYPNDVLGALLMFWLGTLLAQDGNRVRRFFAAFTGFATLIAVHTDIQGATGTILFASNHYDALFLAHSTYQLAGTGAHRAGSFFVDPNWNGTFLATACFLPLGLLVESSSFSKRVLYLTEVLIMLPAVLFTYSNGAIVSVAFGLLIFLGFVGQLRYRILLPLFIGGATTVAFVLFPSQISSLALHASDPRELSLRLGAWKTALRVISAFPLTGVGLGYEAYLERANPYRVPEQFVPLSHPHNSYLEWGAKGGIPVLVVFLALLIYALWLAWRNWALSNARTRSLLGGGLTAILTLSINSWSINGWTLPVLSLTGWLLLGVISSPLLRKNLRGETIHEKKCVTME